MEGIQENPIEISSSPIHSRQGTPTKVSKETERSPSRPPSECSSKSSFERTPPSKSQSVMTGDLFQDNASTCSSTSSTTTSSTPAVVNKRFPIRPGITWRKGERIEAMDFIEKWYPAKIIDIDENDMAVLVHFEGWNQRYDQWMDMSSEKMRPKARHSGRKGHKKSLSAEYKIGDHVYARWTDCKMYPAKISALQSDDAFEVIFYDGFKKIVQGINIKPMPPEIKQQKIEIVHVLPKDLKKRSSTENSENKRLSTETAEASSEQTEITVATVVPNQVVEPKQKKSKGSNPDSRKKALARKRQRLMIAGSLFVNRRRPKPKPKKKAGEVLLPPGETPVSSPSVPIIASTPTIPVAASQINPPTVSGSTSGSFPSTPLPMSPVGISGDRRNKKRLLSPAISETSSESQSDDIAARIRRRSSRSSTADDRVAVKYSQPTIDNPPKGFVIEKDHFKSAVMYTPPTIGVPPKGFVIEKDHNHFKCVFDGCNKGFRKESLLESHIKYYHADNVPPGMVRKRRKTSSICSTDSDASFVEMKRRHMSADSALHTMVPERMEVDAEASTGPVETYPKEQYIKQEPSDLDLQQEVETMVTEECLEAEDELSKDEVVNCICMLNEENGLMIQCEICLCWQHAMCFDLTEATLPRKYICYVCVDPPALRDSCRYIHEQDWLKTGELAGFNFLPQKRDENKCRTLQATNNLVVDTANISTVLQGLKQKIHAVDDKSNPEFKLWTKNWDDENDEGQDDNQSLEDVEEGHTENLDSLESAVKMHSDLNKTSGNTGVSCDNENTSKVDKKDDENLIHDSLDHGTQSEEDAGKDSSGESSVNADSESTLSAPEAIAAQNMQDHEASMAAEEAMHGQIVQEVESEEVEDHIDLEADDPYVNSEKNLLRHVLRVQTALDERLDLIEEQVAALEGADSEDNDTSDILSDIPSIKKSLHMLQNDLIKISRLAAYHR